MNEAEIKKAVRERYSRIAKQESSCCSPGNSCCGPNISKEIGYSDEELKAVPESSNLGLGCGNPVALVSLKEGETVLDLGSGAGFDCFLAANQVGEKGKVIGVDMTPAMVNKARDNAQKGNYSNVEFRLGEIENIPAGDNAVDVIISNCVINISPDKKRAFREAYRVLRPGGRLMVSDIVLLKALPDLIRNSIEAYVGCIAGATMKDEYLATIKSAGFQDIRVFDETWAPPSYITDPEMVQALAQGWSIPPETVKEIANSVISMKVSAVKPTI